MMSTRLSLAVCLLATTLGGCAHLIWGCSYRAPIDEQVVVLQDATRAQIEVGAGSLSVVGQEGTREVRVRGEACSNDELLLPEYAIRVSRDGDTVRIETVMPETQNSEGLIDVVVAVPSDLFVLIRDGSGSIELRGVAGADIEDGSGSIDVEQLNGNLRVQDGSGDLDVRGVRGDVWVTDGSGSIEIEDIEGSVVILEDGSGSIEIQTVSGDVLVRRDGSGSIGVDGVHGSFTVEADSSGDIDVDDVLGPVNIPRD